jgi:predicted DNA-binding transcriptional regulator YafY
MAVKHQLIRVVELVSLFNQNRNNSYNYAEVLEKLEKIMQSHDEVDFSYSEKTFQRDRKLISEALKIDIVFNTTIKKYQIDVESGDLSFFVGDSILLMNAYKQNLKNKDQVLVDYNKAKGLENLYGLLHAIQNRKTIVCQYSKYWDTISEKKTLEPYTLKEFQNRWYLLAKDKNRPEILKTYGLDRISDLEISKSNFQREAVDLAGVFVNSFGIISTLGKEPEEIVLSFDAEQGKYIKSEPLHHSQTILKETTTEFQIKLSLVPTYDFYQELMKHAGRLKIISPKSVKKEYINWLQKAINLNQ